MASHIPQGAFDGMDDATARLILQLERENFTEVGQHFMARVPPELQGDIAFMTQQQRIELELAAAEFRVRAVEGGQAQESEPVHIINPQGYATTAPAEAPQVAEAEIHHVLPVASAVVDQIEAVDIHLDHSESEAEEVGVHPTSDLSSEISTTPGSPPAEKVEIELLAPSPAATIRVLPENDQAEPKDESTGQNSPIEPSHSITNTVPVTNTLNTAPLQSRQTQFNSTAIPPSPNAISTPTGITLMLLFMIGALSTTITPESASSADASVGQHSSKHENPGPEPAASADPNDLISFDDASSEAFASSFITEHQRFHTENEVHSNKVPETSPLSTFEAAFGQNSWDFSKLEVNENRDFKDGTSVVEVLGRSRSFPEPAWGIPSQPTLETPTISPNGSFTESVSETTTISFPYVGIREQGSVETHECLVCQDNLLEKNTITLPCGHECCQSCLREIFSAACRNENKFPPRCCESHTINLQTYQHYLDVELVSLFREKAIEFATPLPRYYCSNSSCGRMLRPEDIDGHRGGCSKCWEWTCIMCSEHWHDGDCPKDENLQKLLALAEENHWQRCRCGFMIEIHDGCNRMEYVFSPLHDQDQLLIILGVVAAVLPGAINVNQLGQMKRPILVLVETPIEIAQQLLELPISMHSEIRLHTWAVQTARILKVGSPFAHQELAQFALIPCHSLSTNVADAVLRDAETVASLPRRT